MNSLIVKIFVFCSVGSIVIINGLPTTLVDDNQENEIETSQTDTAWNRISREYSKCFDAVDAINCVAIKTITAMERAGRLNSIEIWPGIILVRNTQYPLRDGKSISENEIEKSLPNTFTEKAAKLIDLFVESASNFLSTHTLEVKFPEDTTKDLGRALEEGRKKMKRMKMFGHMAMMMGAKLIFLLPLIIIGTKLLALKALVIAKIALILALIGSAGSIGSLFSNKGGSLGTSYTSANTGWTSSYAPSGSSSWSAGGPYSKRSMSGDVAEQSGDVVDAQDIAYSAQKIQ